MDSQYTYYYPLEYTQGKKVVLDCLDRFLFKETSPIMRYYCPYTGTPLNRDTYEHSLFCAGDSVYETTDHTPIEIEIDGIRCLYVSLDNSVRANMNGHSLITRLEKLCKLVNIINP